MRRRDIMVRGLRTFGRFCFAVALWPLLIVRFMLRCVLYVVTMPLVMLGVMKPLAPLGAAHRPEDPRH